MSLDEIKEDLQKHHKFTWNKEVDQETLNLFTRMENILTH